MNKIKTITHKAHKEDNSVKDKTKKTKIKPKPFHHQIVQELFLRQQTQTTLKKWVKNSM